MPSLGKPYLCGGIFLTQLMQARKSRAGVRERYAGESDGLSDPETMLAFIKVVCPDFTVPAGKTFKENTSSYKNCRKNSGTYLPRALCLIYFRISYRSIILYGRQYQFN